MPKRERKKQYSPKAKKLIRDLIVHSDITTDDVSLHQCGERYWMEYSFSSGFSCKPLTEEQWEDIHR